VLVGGGDAGLLGVPGVVDPPSTVSTIARLRGDVTLPTLANRIKATFPYSIATQFEQRPQLLCTNPVENAFIRDPAFDADRFVDWTFRGAQITREYHRFKDYADAALINDSKGNVDLNMTAARRHATQDWQACKTFTDAHVGHYDTEKRTYVQDTIPLPPECLRVRRCQGADDLPY
jgi:hypothetical protein